MLVLDRAGWHQSPRLTLPEGIHLAPLPASSPELRPAERLWPLLDVPIATRALTDLDELEALLVTRCQTLRADPARVHAHTHFHWWPEDRP